MDTNDNSTLTNSSAVNIETVDLSFDQPYDQPAPFSVKGDAFGDATATSGVAATGNNNIDGLLAGIKWASASISYSFTNAFDFRWISYPTTFDYTDYEAGYPDAATHDSSFQTFTAAQQTATNDWIGLGGEFNGVSLLNPNDLTGPNDRDATIRMAMSSDPGTAYAYYPGSTVEAGDIWVNNGATYKNPVIGTYAYHTLGHELGHALGLKHGHETGGVRNVAMNADRDSMEFSIMTYRSYAGDPLSGGYANETGGFAQTLMMHDIAAIQHMYGASFDHNSGDTDYTFSTATGEMFINGIGQGTPYSNDIFRTVWDGNGIDTYDFSNYSTKLSIDLTPEGWTDVDRTGNFQSAYLGGGQYARGQIFNALQYQGDARSLIENAKGGSGADIITGNTANNTLWGGSGNDSINGGDGVDILIGGPGSDTYTVDTTTDTITENQGEGSDTVKSSVTYKLGNQIERLTLTGAAAIDGTGNGLKNTLTGNSADNKLTGAGGNDTMTGGGGNDQFKWLAKVFNTSDIKLSVLDTVTDFNTGDTLDFSTGIEALLTIGGQSLASAAININLPNAFSANTNVAWTGTDFVIDLNADHSITAADFHVQLIGYGGNLVYDAAADTFHG